MPLVPQIVDAVGDRVPVVAAGGIFDGRGLAATGGQYLGPTVIADVTPGMAVAQEEIFGPVLSVLSFETAEEALALVNATDYGLSAAVWSRDVDTCMALATASIRSRPMSSDWIAPATASPCGHATGQIPRPWISAPTPPRRRAG